MLRLITIWTFLFLFSACSRKLKKEFVSKEIELHIVCENEKYLLENDSNNLNYSFDTIASTKSYWKNINHAQANSPEQKLYPYTTITTDSPSLYKDIKISLMGLGEWKKDSRLLTGIDNERIDSKWVTDFYERISTNSDSTETRYKAELFLSFAKDSIVNISKSLKEIAEIYLSVQKRNSKKLFDTELCSLTQSQVTLLKKNTPFRIRLMKSF